MLKLFKKPINVKTLTGYHKAYGISRIREEAIKISLGSFYIKTSMSHTFDDGITSIQSCNLKIGDNLQNHVITNIENIGVILLYDMVNVEGGNLYITNNISSHNCEFLGSASTLISTDALRLMEPKEPITLDSIFSGIRIYEKVIESHSYIVSVDPAKDGIDKFAVQVTDITKFPFVQVASAQLDIDYLMMPEHLETLGLYYNEAYIVIENNEGAGQSIADMLFLTYEYPNMYRDRNTSDKGYKKFYGFRTTLKSRPLILNMMKIFIEEGKLIVNDRGTIDEFFNFIKSDNNRVKYAAEEGYHDDMVMSLALLFAPFIHIKAFDDLAMFLNVLHIDVNEENDIGTAEYYSLLDFGSFNDTETHTITREELLAEAGNDYDPDAQYEAIRQLNR